MALGREVTYADFMLFFSNKLVTILFKKNIYFLHEGMISESYPWTPLVLSKSKKTEG